MRAVHLLISLLWVSPVLGAAAAPEPGAEIAARQCASCHAFTPDEGEDLSLIHI